MTSGPGGQEAGPGDAQRVQPLYMPGDKVAECRIVSFLGRGGAAEVYEAAYQGKPCALKLALPGLDVDLGGRMVREAQILKRLRHPNIVTLYDQGITRDKILWIRMELLRGKTLRKLIHDHRRKHAPLSIPLVVGYLFRAAQGAAQCHVQSIVHRDLKPENVMVVPKGNKHEVKLLDLGTAYSLDGAHTVDVAPMGTPLYMGPELFDARLPVSPATDVYSLACIGYEMLAFHPFMPPDGRLAFPRLAYAHCFLTPPRLEEFGIPTPLADVIARGLSKDPAMRHVDGEAFADALWAAWKVVEASDPEVDTSPGEPSIDRIFPEPDQAVRFGVAPEGRPRRRRSSLPMPAVERATLEPFPTALREPAAFEAELERQSQLASQDLPDGSTNDRATVRDDLGYLHALAARTEARELGRFTEPMLPAPPALVIPPRAAPLSRPFVPTQHTEPLSFPLPRRSANEPRASGMTHPTEPLSSSLPRRSANEPRALGMTHPTEPLSSSLPRRSANEPRASGMTRRSAPRGLAPTAPTPSRGLRSPWVEAAAEDRQLRAAERVLVRLFAGVVLTVWMVAAVMIVRSRERTPTSEPVMVPVASVSPATAAASAAPGERAAPELAPPPSALEPAVSPPAPSKSPTSAPSKKPGSPARDPSPFPTELVDPWGPPSR